MNSEGKKEKRNKFRRKEGKEGHKDKKERRKEFRRK